MRLALVRGNDLQKTNDVYIIDQMKEGGL